MNCNRPVNECAAHLAGEFLMKRMLDAINTNGYALIPDAVTPEAGSTLLAALACVPADGRERKGSVYAARNLLQTVPEVRRFAASETVRALIEPILGFAPLPVRGLLFDKSAEANWKVPWHQDLSIAVRKKMEVPGFGPWSVKAGVIHVQPPVAVLERMLALRLHLDDCGEQAGPLRVLPGSHLQGRLDPQAIRRWRENVRPVSCLVPCGGILLMRPLLLHASGAALSPSHRRVVHLEFAAEPLPSGLEWYEALKEAPS
jgi:hypothetical protein